MVVYMSIVERTMVFFLDVVSSNKYLENISRAVRNLSNITKPKTIFLKKNAYHSYSFKKSNSMYNSKRPNAIL
jgi:hypothetical protein